MSEYIHKSHNVLVLMYHSVCPAKYRRVIINENIDKTLKETCVEISKRYEIKFIEIGAEGGHVHFLIQPVPVYSPTKIVKTIKSITAKEIFKRHPEVKEKLWGGEFWSDGHFISTVGQYGNESTIANYVKMQGTEEHYKKLYKIQNNDQPGLFNDTK